MKQQANLKISVVKTGKTITITAENTGGKPYTVRLINVQAYYCVKAEPLLRFCLYLKKCVS